MDAEQDLKPSSSAEVPEKKKKKKRVEETEAVDADPVPKKKKKLSLPQVVSVRKLQIMSRICLIICNQTSR